MKKPLLIATFVSLAVFKSGASIYVDLNSVSAGGGLDATALLASYGITVTGITGGGGDPYIRNDTDYGGGVTANPAPNLLIQQGNANGESYTLNFSTPLAEFQFTQCAIGATTASPIWSVTAYEGVNELRSVGATFIDDTGTPAQPYTFTAGLGSGGITSVTVYGDAENFASLYSVPMDDIYLTPYAAAPEPATTTTFAGIAALGMVGWTTFRKKFSTVG